MTMVSLTLIGGTPIQSQRNHRHPRLWRAVYATHRAPHPRTECFFRRAALYGLARRSQELRARWDHPFGGAMVRVRRGCAASRRARLRVGVARARHLLWAAIHGAYAGRHSAAGGEERVRPRGSRGWFGVASFSGTGEKTCGLDVAW